MFHGHCHGKVWDVCFKSQFNYSSLIMSAKKHGKNLDHFLSWGDFVDERFCRKIDHVNVGQRLRVEVFVPRRDGGGDVDPDVAEERLVVVLNDGKQVVLENLMI